MLNAPHIVETAILILVAFLIGAVAGYFARRMVAPKAKVATTAPEEKPAAPATGPQLVVPPEIAPLPVAKAESSPAKSPPAKTAPAKRSPAKRLAAAAARSPEPDIDAVVPAPVPPPVAPAPATMEPPVPPAREIAPTEAIELRPSSVETPAEAALAADVPAQAMGPAHVAGETTSGAAVPTPHPSPAPAVTPEPPAGPVRAEDVPPIDEAAHVVDRPVPAEQRTEAPSAFPSPEEPIPLEEDAEIAARRAIEGNWTPRRRAASPAPPPEASAEMEQAMAGARSAVAAATAAAQAAVSGAESTDHVAASPPAELTFDAAAEATPEPFLAGTSDAQPAGVGEGGLAFEPARHAAGFGRPEGLPAPRGGVKDDLKQIKGVTPAIESSLNQIGIFHFDQVAAWDQKAIVWLDHHLGLKGRAGREKWVEQARGLAAGRPRTARPVRR